MNVKSTEFDQYVKSEFLAKRDALICAFEAVEESASHDLYGPKVGRVKLTSWERTQGGGGEGGLLQGRFFEKAAIHFSHVFGELSDSFRGQVQGTESSPNFEALGVSVIAHPLNPFVPTGHMNVRFIKTSKTWFGGGLDLSPMLMQQRSKDSDVARTFLAACRNACADQSIYERYSEKCDSYFHLHHRGEPRGIGGLFVDHYNSGDLEEDLQFMLRIVDAFLEGYFAVIEQTHSMTWTAQDRDQQLLQRGRYVEFNLLHDRGTLFGLKTGGNVETILSSLPPLVGFK